MKDVSSSLHRLKSFSSACAALLLFVAFSSNADVVTLTPVADTHLNSFYPTTILGSDPGVKVGTSGPGGGPATQRGLLRFALASIPAASTIESVQLKISVVQAPLSDTVPDFGLFRVLVGWEETEATWVNRLSETAWSAPGGAPGMDYLSTASASIPIMFEGDKTYNSTPALVADVQAWVDSPSANQGWMIISDMEGVQYSARKIGSRETTSPAQLTINYLPPPRIESVKLIGTSLQLAFTADAPYNYEVRAAESVTPIAWQTLTNYSAKFSSFDVLFSDPTTNRPQRFYRVWRTGPIR